MTRLLILTSIFFLCACDPIKKDIGQSTKLYYLSVKMYSGLDTIPFDSLKTPKNDSLIASDHFQYNGQIHNIDLYSNDFTAAHDGGEANYRLDSLGIIYLKSTTWPNYLRLKSNKDSVNDLIQFALDYVLISSRLHCYNCIPPIGEVVKFIPPKEK